MTYWLVVALTLVYLIICLVAAYERNWSTCLYFIGATIINIGLLLRS